MKLASTLIPLYRKTALLFVIYLSISASSLANGLQAPPVFWNVVDIKSENDVVMLKWIVTEYNNKAFYIEHSLDGRRWKTVDSVGTKDSPLTLDEYNYKHVNALQGRQYYRIRQVDIDLTRSGYSKVVSIVLGENADDESQATGITLSPNPATSEITLVGHSETAGGYTKATIFDLSGKKVSEKKLDAHNNSIDIRDLAPGIYILRGDGAEGRSFTRKIIKR